MPVPHLEIRIVQRSKGKSAVAGAAYQAGEKLFSEYDQKWKNYTYKKEVVYLEIMLPPNAPPEYADRATLWNSAEEVEKQWNSQLARRFVVALPREVPLDMCPQMMQEYCREHFVSKGMCCDFAIHDPDPPGHNPHCHIMLTMRAIEENGKWMPKSRKVYDLDEAVGCEPLGAAWFVEGVYEQPTPLKELEALAYVNLGAKAVVGEGVGEFAPNYDATGSIALKEYAPNYLKYEYEAPAEALAVFSEIYFADGWKAYVDGVEAEYFVADYILRGMKLPEGKHVVEWKFKAPQWGMATAITGVCSWLILLGLVVAFVLAVRGVVKNKKR